MLRAVPTLSMLGRTFPAIRWRKRWAIRNAVPLSVITFTPPAETWGTVTHTIGPFVPLPARRDCRFERRLARMRDRIKAALVITED